MKKLTTYFSKGELALWGSSAGLILLSFFLFDRVNFMTLAASLIGTTSLIFNAKGNPFGQALMILFSLLYGVISYTFSYFGEMITYLGMTGPMALFALISWLRNPYQGNRAEVAVNRLGILVILGVLLQGHDDIRTGSFLGGFLNGVAVSTVGDPLPGLVLTILAGDDRDGGGYHKGRVETDAELADDIDILLLFHGLLEAQRTGLGNGA